MYIHIHIFLKIISIFKRQIGVIICNVGEFSANVINTQEIVGLQFGLVWVHYGLALWL